MATDLVLERLVAGPVAGPRANAAFVVRLVSAAVFIVFGLGKFVDHQHEVDSFTTYGLPAPDVFVYVIGVIEIGGGVLLLAGILTRLVALMLAGDMIGAVVTSGILQGELVSLTLAPALLVMMGFLLWSGPGRLAVDNRLRRAERHATA